MGWMERWIGVELWSQILPGSSPFSASCQVSKPLGSSVSPSEKWGNTTETELLLMPRVPSEKGLHLRAVVLKNKNGISTAGSCAFGTPVFLSGVLGHCRFLPLYLSEPQFPHP